MSDVLLVAGREVRERLGSPLFRWVNIGLIALILAATLLPGLLASGARSTTIGVVGAEAEAVARAARTMTVDSVGGTGPGELTVTELADEPSARAAVEAEDVDVALLDPTTAVTRTGLSDSLRGRLESAHRSVRLSSALTEAGVPPAERQALLTGEPLQVTTLEEVRGIDFGPQVVVGLAATAALYGMLIFYGQLVGQGIAREKESRVIELLLATVSPTRLLAGKIVGLGALGFAQVLVLAAVGALGLQLGGQITVTGDIATTLLLVIAWYVLGYALYSTLFALSGAIISRVEDLQVASMPTVAALLGALLLAQFTVASPDSTVGVVAGLLPFSAPLIQPLRMATGSAHLWQATLAVVLTVATIAGLIPLTARVYTGAALVTRGRIGVRDALRRNSQ